MANIPDRHFLPGKEIKKTILPDPLTTTKWLFSNVNNISHFSIIK